MMICTSEWLGLRGLLLCKDQLELGKVAFANWVGLRLCINALSYWLWVERHWLQFYLLGHLLASREPEQLIKLTL
jgi:hypothetical protein